MELTFYGAAVIALVSQLLGLNVQAILDELKQHGVLHEATKWAKAKRVVNEAVTTDAEWYKKQFDSLIWKLLPVCKQEGAIGILPWGVTFKTPYGAVEINGIHDILQIQGEAWRMQELLRDVAKTSPDAKVAAKHYNFPTGLSFKRPAQQLARELEALRHNTSNETLEIVAYTRAPLEELSYEPEWTEFIQYNHVRHSDGSESGVGWYRRPGNPARAGAGNPRQMGVS